jgi:uncharacterized membrane protein
MIVHFPLALVVWATFALLLAKLWPNPRVAAALATTGTWNLGLGAVASVFALATGLGAALHLHLTVPARQTFSMHVRWAVFTALALLLVATWRCAGDPEDARPSWLLLIVLGAATAALIVTGYLGGQNVYRFGIGVHV